MGMTSKAIVSNCNVLIIEMHPKPNESAVDPLQPLNYKKFSEVLNNSK